MPKWNFELCQQKNSNNSLITEWICVLSAAGNEKEKENHNLVLRPVILYFINVRIFRAKVQTSCRLFNKHSCCNI